MKKKGKILIKKCKKLNTDIASSEATGYEQLQQLPLLVSSNIDNCEVAIVKDHYELLCTPRFNNPLMRHIGYLTITAQEKIESLVSCIWNK